MTRVHPVICALAEVDKEGLTAFVKMNHVFDDATASLMSLGGRSGCKRDSNDTMVMGALAASAYTNTMFGVKGVHSPADYFQWLSKWPKGEVRVCA
jgi:hypothetical protein